MGWIVLCEKSYVEILALISSAHDLIYMGPFQG